MSLLNYVSAKEGQKRKRDDDGDSKTTDSKTKDKKYDATNRQRRFQSHWKNMWSWLEYLDTENKMFCRICRKYPSISESRAVGIKNQFVEGTSYFRIGAIKSHAESKAHLECSNHFRQQEELQNRKSFITFQIQTYH